MSLPDNQIKELLQKSYVRALAAVAGVIVEAPESDFGVDLILAKVAVVKNKPRATGTRISLQLKASENCIIDGNNVIYDLDAEAYNKFADWEGHSKCYLVVMVIPKDRAEWVYLTEEHLILKRCCYWFHIPEGNPTKNKRSVRIMIPRSQVFSPETIKELLEEI